MKSSREDEGKNENLFKTLLKKYGKFFLYNEANVVVIIVVPYYHAIASFNTQL
jgi:hypothetical protein